MSDPNLLGLDLLINKRKKVVNNHFKKNIKETSDNINNDVKKNKYNQLNQDIKQEIIEIVKKKMETTNFKSEFIQNKNEEIQDTNINNINYLDSIIESNINLLIKLLIYKNLKI